MNILLTMILMSLMACRDTTLVIEPLVEEEQVFEMEWTTRIDFEKEVGSNAEGVFYNMWYVKPGDLNDPAIIYGFNVETGDKDWTYIYEGWDNSNIDFLYISNRILICVTGKRVFGFDLDTQEMIWEENLRDEELLRGSGIVASNGKFYLNVTWKFSTPSAIHHLLEFDPLSGAFDYFLSSGSGDDLFGNSPPVIWTDPLTGREVMIINEYPDAGGVPESNRQNIVAYDIDTKEEIWRVEDFTNFFPSNGGHPPIIYNDLVITGGDWHMYAFDIRTGEQRWKTEISDDSPFSIFTKTNHLIHNGRLYVNENGENVTCLNPETGDLIWNNPKGGPNCTDNMVYYEKEDLLVFTSWGYGSVMILDALTGELIHREHRFDNSSYNNDVVYDEERDMFFTSTYKHAVGFKVTRK